MGFSSKTDLADTRKEIQFPKMNMDRLPFYEAKVLFSEGRGRI